MPETKASGLPDKPADDVIFGDPVNERPSVVLPDPDPKDTERERIVTEGATHIVIADHFGIWERGDKIKEEDLPEGATSFEDLARLKPYPPVRPLKDEEKPKPEEVTKHDSKRKKAAPVVDPYEPEKVEVEVESPKVASHPVKPVPAPAKPVVSPPTKPTEPPK